MASNLDSDALKSSPNARQTQRLPVRRSRHSLGRSRRLPAARSMPPPPASPPGPTASHSPLATQRRVAVTRHLPSSSTSPLRAPTRRHALQSPLATTPRRTTGGVARVLSAPVPLLGADGRRIVPSRHSSGRSASLLAVSPPLSPHCLQDWRHGRRRRRLAWTATCPSARGYPPRAAPPPHPPSAPPADRPRRRPWRRRPPSPPVDVPRALAAEAAAVALVEGVGRATVGPPPPPSPFPFPRAPSGPPSGAAAAAASQAAPPPPSPFPPPRWSRRRHRQRCHPPAPHRGRPPSTSRRP